MLDAWACQLDPKGIGCPVYYRERDQLRVLAGALLAIASCEPSGHAAVAGEMANALVAAGILRDYQGAAVAAAYAAPGWRSIILAPAGAGKTRMAAGLVAVGAQLGACRWVYLVQNQQLAAQTADQFSTWIPRMVAELGDCDWVARCGTYGTMELGALEEAHGLIVDEVHLAGAPTRAAAIARARAAEFRCGLSATPLLRQDAGNAHVIGLLGPVRYSISPEELIGTGCLARGKFIKVHL